MFAPCNIPLPKLIEQHKEQMQRSAEQLRAAMQGARIQPHVADAIRRRETATLLALEKLQSLEPMMDQQELKAQFEAECG